MNIRKDEEIIKEPRNVNKQSSECIYYINKVEKIAHENPQTWRPITILTAISKVVERVLNAQAKLKLIDGSNKIQDNKLRT